MTILEEIRAIKISALPQKFNHARYTQQLAIVSQLYQIGLRHHYIPLFEFQQPINTPWAKRKTKRGRLDIVFVNETDIIWAFEVDYTLKRLALLKLKSVPAQNKVFILLAPERERVIKDVQVISLPQRRE